MIWAKVRFCLSHSGVYADCVIGVVAQSIPEGANLVAAIMAGYEVGTGGFKTCIHEVRGLKGPNEIYYIMPDDTEKLTQFLKGLDIKS